MSTATASNAPASATGTGTTTTANHPPPFRFPREHSFPPFFTLQPNATTRHAQLTKWSSLVLAYARHHRLFRLSVSSSTSSSTTTTSSSSAATGDGDAAAASPLFRNKTLDRRLSPADVREILAFMRREGRVETVPGGGNGSGNGNGSGKGDEDGDVVFIYWRKPEEWARLVEDYVERTGQKGAVMTIYELAEGEATRGSELHGIDADVLRRALGVLVKKGRAQIFGQDGSQGVKFF
ncbi:hypothetical protein N3K66_004879 [Trichothecium roseum]|uniref:Uncharacterized protein n=1 Tax=Trichothecium roseum TaxID=47278 RepID=A0ACC0V2V4_9HYPO|nr:hypothetical protein N3K66_004879 [Trichothecium roseum]